MSSGNSPEAPPAAGRVYLVGAGPGDPELVTMRARRVLAEADLVVYDHLVHPELLTWAPSGAERVRMGKVGHAEQCPQSEITATLVRNAREGRVVVRLKGGDPCVFGRVADEARALAEAGISFEIVPGVTAASGAAAYAGIPLTERDRASSVTFVTGHRQRAGGREDDWPALARTPGTLVIYMGVKHLAEVAARLLAGGRSSATPVALVRRATWPDQEVLVGTLGNIAERAREASFGPPAVAIVGEVVALRDELDWFGQRPLKGKRILVTRGAHQAGELSERLRARGAVPVELPLIELRACGHQSAVETCFRKLFAYDWVVFSSANAVGFTFAKLDEMGLDARAFGAARVCAVGPKTAEALAGRGIRPDVVPETYVAEALVAALAAEARLAGASVLIPRAREAREVIPAELERQGARVDVLPVYENVRPETYPAEALAAVREGRLDLVTLASSSAARNYAALCREHGADPAAVPCAAIGPVAARTAETEGLRVVAVPSEYTLEGMVSAAEDYFARIRSDR